MSLATATRPAAAEQRAEDGFRADLEGLRGVAVLLVVAFHADVAGFAGGFIGVDVFFVLSGWLITRQLLREASSSGTVRLRDFWARRVRRLVPALALVTLVTLLAAGLIANPLELARTASHAVAAITYTSNFVFAQDAAGYFAPESESLFLHTWSLAVEEQFYLVWPLGVLGLAVLTRRRPSLLRPAAIVGFVGVGAASLLAAVLFTSTGAPFAFFGLPTRAWEFAGAGVVAAAWTRRPNWGFLAWLGVGAIVLAAVAFDSSTPYPSLPTVVPVAGTLALIMFGQGRAGPAGLLSTGVLRTLGRVSYSWYLWHWPVILLGVEWAGTDSMLVRCAGALVALGLAGATYRWLENPIRFSPGLKASRWRTYTLGATASVVVLASAVGLRAYSDRIFDDPLLQRVRAAREELDDAVPCSSATAPTGATYCLYGDPSASRSVLLLGDSHAEQWIPGLAAAAEEMPVRLAEFARGGCPPAEMALATSTPGMLSDACKTHQAAIGAVLDAEQPDLVVIAVSDFYGKVLAPTGVRGPSRAEGRQLYTETLASLVDDLHTRGAEVAFILDNPWLPEDPTTCVADTRSLSRCTTSSATALASTAWLVEAQRAISADADLPAPFDILDKICPAPSCRLDDGEMFLWGDDDHLSPRYTRSQASALVTWMADALS